MVTQKSRKRNKQPPSDQFRPLTDPDRRICATLAQSGYIVGLGFLKRGNRTILAAYPRYVTRGQP